MKRKKTHARIWYLPISVGVLFVFLYSIGWPPGHEEVSYPPEASYVSFVIDGDTIELADGERVRYIGINTPEIGQSPGHEPECYGLEALVRNRELVNGRRVWLVREDSDRDRYDRLLRHVYLENPDENPDATLVGEVLVREGFARAVFIRPDVGMYDALRRFQDAARASGAGLWQTCR